MTSQVRVPSERASSGSKRYDAVDLPFLAQMSRWESLAIISFSLPFAIFMISATIMKFLDLRPRSTSIDLGDLIIGSFGISIGLILFWLAMNYTDMIFRKSNIVLTADGFKDSRSRISADWRSIVSAVPFGAWYIRGIQLKFERPVEMTIPFGIGRFAWLWRLRRRKAVIFTTGLDQSSSLVEKIILELLSRSFDVDAQASDDRK